MAGRTLDPKILAAQKYLLTNVARISSNWTEEAMQWFREMKIHLAITDGSSKYQTKIMKDGTGVYYTDGNREIVQFRRIPLLKDNNIVELQSSIDGLRCSLDEGAEGQNLILLNDNERAIKLLTKKFEAPNVSKEHYGMLKDIIDLEAKFNSVVYHHMSKAWVGHADFMATWSTDAEKLNKEDEKPNMLVGQKHRTSLEDAVLFPLVGTSAIEEYGKKINDIRTRFGEFKEHFEENFKIVDGRLKLVEKERT